MLQNEKSWRLVFFYRFLCCLFLHTHTHTHTKQFQPVTSTVQMDSIHLSNLLQLSWSYFCLYCLLLLLVVFYFTLLSRIRCLKAVLPTLKQLLMGIDSPLDVRSTLDPDLADRKECINYCLVQLDLDFSLHRHTFSICLYKDIIIT